MIILVKLGKKDKQKMRCSICNQLIYDNLNICGQCENKIKVEQIEDDEHLFDSILENINHIVEEYEQMKNYFHFNEKKT